MSNLKNNFTAKLVSVTATAKNGRYIYTAAFEDGTSSVIRTSNRAYLSVTQIRCHHKVDRTDFLFSAKPTPSLGKNELHRVIATVIVNAGTPAPCTVPEQ